MHDLWVEKYRPDTLDGYVFKDADMKEQIHSWVNNRENRDIPFPNLLLSGAPGSGKTTISSILCNIFDVNKDDILTINASRDNNVETVRNRILGFCTTFPIGKFKVVRLEECLWEDEYIKTPTGSMRLGDMEDNTTYPVLSFNMETREIEEDTATVISRKEDDVYEVTLEDGRIIHATLNHPFLVESEGKVVEKKLEDLVEGDEIISEVSGTVGIISIRTIAKIGKKNVVNLTVKKNHTFITKNGIITHNCDHLSINAQAILRSEIERFSNGVRFILTCNYPTKIIPALRSRLQTYHFDTLDLEGYFTRMIEILDAEKVEYNPEYLEAFIDTAFPDLRKGINLLDQHTWDGKLHPLKEHSESKDYLLDMANLFKKKDFKKARQLICSQASPEEYEEIYRYFYQNIEIFGETDEQQTQAIIEISNGIYRHAIVADPEINLAATLCKLASISE